MAALYRASYRPPINLHKRFNGDLNYGSNFNGSLEVRSDTTGLYIAAPVFGLSCKPLLIPWPELRMPDVQYEAPAGMLKFTTNGAPDVVWQLFATPALVADVLSPLTNR